MEKILRIENLKVTFGNNEEIIAVNDISLDFIRGETLALAGESGSGKTVTALAILKLIEPPGLIKNGKIYYRDFDLFSLTDKQLNAIRGKEISMIFQEPSTAYDNFFTVGQQFSEIMKWHLRFVSSEAKRASIEWLSKIGFRIPHQVYDSYPFQLSGGMQQRAMIAMALCCNPTILIADEPTTSLDVISQAQIITLILNLKKEMDLSVLLISHDFGLIAQSADRVAIMYKGRIAEIAPVKELYEHPAHHYTRMLLKSIPDFKSDSFPYTHTSSLSDPMKTHTLKHGCPYYPRCNARINNCKEKYPPLTIISAEHHVFCWNL